MTEAIGGNAYAHAVIPIDIGSLASQMDYCRIGNDTLYNRSNYNAEDGIFIPSARHIADGKSYNERSRLGDESRWKNYHDITGRRLATPPARGLYIEGGRPHLCMQPLAGDAYGVSKKEAPKQKNVIF